MQLNFRCTDIYLYIYEYVYLRKANQDVQSSNDKKMHSNFFPLIVSIFDLCNNQSLLKKLKRYETCLNISHWMSIPCTPEHNLFLLLKQLFGKSVFICRFYEKKLYPGWKVICFFILDLLILDTAFRKRSYRFLDFTHHIWCFNTFNSNLG